MSRLGRLLPSVAQPRRYYSIFSSRSGNGRYFNASKPAKVITSATSKSGPSSEANTSNGGAHSEPVNKLADDVQSPTQEQVAVDVSQQFATSTTPASKDAPVGNAGTPRPAVPPTNVPPYSALKANDLLLHRFFALHRPCLLLNQPANALFESSVSPTRAPPSPLGTIDDPPVASAEADSDAARQLSRSLVLNKVGNLVDWEHTLARLGLSEEKVLNAPVSAGISLDSVKRKRRKKMKKHKLKKRRRLTRAARQRSA